MSFLFIRPILHLIWRFCQWQASSRHQLKESTTSDSLYVVFKSTSQRVQIYIKMGRILCQWVNGFFTISTDMHQMELSCSWKWVMKFAWSSSQITPSMTVQVTSALSVDSSFTHYSDRPLNTDKTWMLLLMSSGCSFSNKRQSHLSVLFLH